MIKETIKIHDKFQFEIKIGYDLNREEKKTTFDIDSYFFIPNNLGINRDTYSRSDFFNDMQIYIRFKTPTFLLESLAKKENEIYGYLKSSIERMVSDRTSVNCGEYENQLKMFCCILKATLRDHVDCIYVRKTLQDEEVLVNKFINGAKEVMANFRSLRQMLAIPNLADKLFSFFLFADEYASLLIEQFSFKIIHILANRGPGKEGLVDALKSLIKSEMQYRTENKYPSIVQNDGTNEVFLYRSSVLKKFMGSILFLSVKRQSEVKMVEHFLYAVAAGISMVVATGIAFYSQMKLGNLTFPFFVALVVSYMFKDRIKAVFQQFFSEQIRKYFYDQKEKIFYSPNQSLGVCKESFDFCDSRTVPQNVVKIRNCDHMTEIENGWVGQNIIRYKRSVELYSAKIKETFHSYQVNSVNDILRFNVSKFLAKMDDPTKSLYCLSDDAIKRVSADRAYHINLIMKFSIKTRKTFYKRFRIILNREGINRLEEVPIGLLDDVN